jgi:hypothetical protein
MVDDAEVHRSVGGLLGNAGRPACTICAGPQDPAMAATAAGARACPIPSAATAAALTTRHAAGHFVKPVNRQLIDFNVQIGHVTLLFWEGS